MSLRPAHHRNGTADASELKLREQLELAGNPAARGALRENRARRSRAGRDRRRRRAQPCWRAR